jgi:galactokinase
MREVRADAPGRVNLIGEHTDYHDGFVMPCAIPQRTRAELRVREDRTARVSSAQAGGAAIEYEVGVETPGRGWADYVQGVTFILDRCGHKLSGFDLRLDSSVPVGSGLSSSAALEVAVLRALRRAFDLELDDVELARVAQRAEVEFVGAPVGIMDQMASSLAAEGEALFLDTRTLGFERLPVPSSIEIVVIDSGVTHQHAGGDYVTRRRESEAAAQALGVSRLRDVGVDALPRIAQLAEPLSRRARHIVTENARVLEAREAMRRGDAVRLGELFVASHASMRDDYEVSVPAVDLLVELAMQERDVYGARLTGGGFGGAIVIAAAAGRGAAVAHAVAREYSARRAGAGRILIPNEPSVH